MKNNILKIAIVMAVIIILVVIWNLLPASFRIPATCTAVVCLPLGWYAHSWWDKYMK